MIFRILLLLVVGSSMPSIDWANTSPKDIASYLLSYHHTSTISGARPCSTMTLDLCPAKHDCMIIKSTCKNPDQCSSTDKLQCIPQNKFITHLKAQKDTEPPTTPQTITHPVSTPPAVNACTDSSITNEKIIDQLVSIGNNVHRLHVSTQKRSFTETVAYCDALGLSLPVPQSKASLEFWSNVLNIAGEYYLGLSDGVREGQWLNVNDNTPINFTAWALHEPNNKGEQENNAKLNCRSEYVDIPSNIRLTSVCVGQALNRTQATNTRRKDPGANCVYFPSRTAYQCNNWESKTLIQELKLAASVAQHKTHHVIGPKRAETKLNRLLHEENWSTYNGANITFFRKIWQKAERRHLHIEPLTSILFRPCIADHLAGIQLFMNAVIDDNIDPPIVVILTRMFTRCLGETPPTKLRRSVMVSVLKYMSLQLQTNKAKEVMAEIVNILRHDTPLVNPAIENLRVFSAVRRVLRRLHETTFLESSEFIKLQRDSLLTSISSGPVDNMIEKYALQLEGSGAELLKHMAELLLI